MVLINGRLTYVLVSRSVSGGAPLGTPGAPSPGADTSAAAAAPAAASDGRRPRRLGRPTPRTSGSLPRLLLLRSLGLLLSLLLLLRGRGLLARRQPVLLLLELLRELLTVRT